MDKQKCIKILLDEYSRAGYEIFETELNLIDTICKLDLSYQLHNIIATLEIMFQVPKGLKLERDSWTIYSNYHKRLIEREGETDENFNKFSYFQYLDDGMRFTNAYTPEQFSRFAADCQRGQDIRRSFTELDTRQWAQ